MAEKYFYDALLLGGQGAGMTVTVERDQSQVSTCRDTGRHFETFRYERVTFKIGFVQDWHVFVPADVEPENRALFAIAELSAGYKKLHAEQNQKPVLART